MIYNLLNNLFKFIIIFKKLYNNLYFLNYNNHFLPNQKLKKKHYHYSLKKII